MIETDYRVPPTLIGSNEEGRMVVGAGAVEGGEPLPNPVIKIVKPAALTDSSRGEGSRGVHPIRNRGRGLEGTQTAS